MLSWPGLSIRSIHIYTPRVSVILCMCEIHRCPICHCIVIFHQELQLRWTYLGPRHWMREADSRVLGRWHSREGRSSDCSSGARATSPSHSRPSISLPSQGCPIGSTICTCILSHCVSPFICPSVHPFMQHQFYGLGRMLMMCVWCTHTRHDPHARSSTNGWLTLQMQSAAWRGSQGCRVASGPVRVSSSTRATGS